MVKTNPNYLQLSQQNGISNPKINANTQIPAFEAKYLMGKSWLSISPARYMFPCVHLGPFQANISLQA